MANDDEWVADVRRWCRRGRIDGPDVGALSHGEECDGAMLGCEAALPPLQARHWPDAAFDSQGDASVV
ncbi:hypothetical protein [Methylibium petroleiphilum]|uniref:hypothetical protein n=2 Tax=Methylibium TaxID=316612 RepID=UPI00003CC9F2|nr:hypothetical protein [Methylibium petroleiphilum]